MGSGNSFADQSDREYQRQGQCPCGGQFEQIDWCAPEHCRCEEGCGNDTMAFDCAVIETRLLCKRCGVIVREEE